MLSSLVLAQLVLLLFVPKLRSVHSSSSMMLRAPPLAPEMPLPPPPLSSADRSTLASYSARSGVVPKKGKKWKGVDVSVATNYF
jgi:hypothetical protein